MYSKSVLKCTQKTTTILKKHTLEFQSDYFVRGLETLENTGFKEKTL